MSNEPRAPPYVLLCFPHTSLSTHCMTMTNACPAISSLRLGSTAPNFKAETTIGHIDFHEWIGDKWVILFSHPEDYTPVCTTELAALAKYQPEFEKRGVKLIGLSANTVETHGGWINDIDGKNKNTLPFHLIFALLLSPQMSFVS